MKLKIKVPIILWLLLPFPLVNLFLPLLLAIDIVSEIPPPRIPDAQFDYHLFHWNCAMLLCSAIFWIANLAWLKMAAKRIQILRERGSSKAFYILTLIVSLILDFLAPLFCIVVLGEGA